jgi:NAD(P)-dependent dehydrogenase (short-subunit alcohol dehydrogenase family)
MKRLADKVAIVTGAAQGLGAAFARALAAEGARVALVDCDDPSPVAEVIRAAGGVAIPIVADVADATAVARMVQATLETFGGIQILVNNAAISGNLEHKPLTAISSQEWHSVIATNLGSVFECTKAVAPVMQRQSYGKIVNLATAAFFLGVDNMAHYMASKGAIIGLTRATARELGRDGIRVNAIAPGLTMSASLSAQAWTRGDIGKAIVASRSIRREEVPEDLIGTLLYLASPDSDFVTGQTIVVDGGGAMH